MKISKMDNLLKTIPTKAKIPISTDTKLDILLSSEGGLMPCSLYMIIGEAGIGKSTVLLDSISNIHHKGKKVLFVSCEMDKFAMRLYVERFPKIGQLDICFTMNQENLIEELRKIFSMGWDVVLIDSYKVLYDQLKEQIKGADTILYDLFTETIEDHLTSFLIIQHMTKAGTFVGSSKLKYMISAMLEMRFDKLGRRYIGTDKNRLGGQNVRLFYSLSQNNDVNYYSVEKVK